MELWGTEELNCGENSCGGLGLWGKQGMGLWGFGERGLRGKGCGAGGCGGMEL